MMADALHAQGDVPDAAHWIAECETLVTKSGHRIAYRRQGSGPAVVLCHGFPTWSYDYAEVARDLARDHQVVTLDFLGYGASDKPKPYDYKVAESADIVEQLVVELGLGALDLVIHDYGAIVGQELLDRRSRGALGFDIRSLTILNCGIVYSAYRPTRLQKMLIKPVIGPFLARRVSRKTMRSGLDAIRGTAKLTDMEFANLWYGVSLNDGHKLANLLIQYNAERAIHHARWEAALRAWGGPLHLIWGLEDPVSGRHVLQRAIEVLPHAAVTELEGVGHFPMAESPARAVAAIREGIDNGA